MNYLKNRRGFSLFEVLIASALMAIIIGVLGRFSSTVTSLEKVISQKLQVEGDLEHAFQRLVTEVRSAEPSSLGAYAIESAASSSFIFFSDVNQDGLVDRVRYLLGTSTLDKGVVHPTGTPLVYVTSTEILTTIVPDVIRASSTFQYFGASATTTANPLAEPVSASAVRVIRFTVTADVSSSSAPRPVTFIHTVTVRNLRSN